MSINLKKIVSIVSLAALLLCMLIPTSAAGKVTYQGQADGFIFEPGSKYSPTDLFSDIKNAMPGDSITQKITVKNAASKNVKVKIYMRSLGAHEDSVDFLSQLTMKVGKSENNTMAYMFDATADQTDGLTEWTLLGTLYSGGEVNLDVTIDIPIELDNKYQAAIGYIDWEFKVEEYPIDPDDPTPPPTGDAMPFYIGGACVCIFLIVFLVAKKRRRTDER